MRLHLNMTMEYNWSCIQLLLMSHGECEGDNVSCLSCQMCHLLHHLTDCQNRHRVEYLIAAANSFVADCQKVRRLSCSRNLDCSLPYKFQKNI